jgi:hypothetical protein
VVPALTTQSMTKDLAASLAKLFAIDSRTGFAFGCRLIVPG